MKTKTEQNSPMDAPDEDLRTKILKLQEVFKYPVEISIVCTPNQEIIITKVELFRDYNNDNEDSDSFNPIQRLTRPYIS